MLRVAGCGLNVGFFKTRNTQLVTQTSQPATRNP